MTNAIFTLREATPKDAADLLIIDNIASHGMSLAFWQDAVAKGEAEDPLSYARERFAERDFIFGWANAVVAEMNDMVVGAVTSYTMPKPDADAQAIKREYPGFAPVFQLFEEVVGEWFVDSLAVYPRCRGKGIAGKLVDQSLKTGRCRGLNKVSLVVEDSNRDALRIYQSRGFKTRNSLPYVADKGEKTETENWLLLSANL